MTVEAPASADVLALPELPRALEELLENAVDHAETTPAIGIEVETVDGAVELEVRDTGPPIPGNEFEPLVGTTEPDDLYHGTGLGLWLVYWIVDLSDGDVAFTRAADGNVVTLTLPQPVE